ncbi:MAG: hypothetical protein NXI31_24975 [bacterium]|nr:hypothetical protein [bacterium]
MGMLSGIRSSASVAALQSAVAGTLVLTFAACSGGGNTPAAVRGIALSEQSTGHVPVEFELVDPESDPIDVELWFSVDAGVTWRRGTVAADDVAVATTGLASSPTGTTHLLYWDAAVDLGARASTDYLVEVRPVDTVTQEDGVPAVAGAMVTNLPTARERVEHYLIHFGPMDASKIAIAETHDLVILYSCHPSISREVVAEIQDGVDANDPGDDVLVLGYVNVGEDERTIGVSDLDLLLDQRFVGDGTGPRLDPRGRGAAGQSLMGLDPRGLPSVGGGYASFYLDDNSLETHGVGDGRPDRNGYTGACYVNLGDPAWFDVLDNMECASVDGRNGFRELLTTSYGLGLGCDGVMLDNVDTCAPNLWTGPGDPDQAEFEWTAAGYESFVSRLRSDYPDKLILQNRGLFFFHPDLPHYELSPRSNIDFVKLESYRLDSFASREFDAFTFADNKFNWGPKLQAEAYREDGFQILSLGYAEGPGIDHGTLTGSSVTGLATLLEDIVETQERAGYRHYLHDAGGGIINQFVRDNADFTDATPPVWTSTYNDNQPGYPTPPNAPTPRVGIQAVVPESGAVTVRWDVALDLNPVRYRLYYSTLPYSAQFSSIWFSSAATQWLQPAIGTGYAGGVGPGVYPYEGQVTGLRASTRYWFAIRAVDRAGNADDNRVVLSTVTRAAPLAIRIDGSFGDWDNVPWRIFDWRTRGQSAGPDWRLIKVAHDEDYLYVQAQVWDRFQLDGSPRYSSSQFEIYLDVDDDPFSGYRISNLGSELMVLGDELVAQRRGGRNAGVVTQLAFEPRRNVVQCELAIPRAELDRAAGGSTKRIRMLFRDASTGDLAPNYGYLRYDMP